MHTVTNSQKTDLLEALDELFSQENLDKYQMTETHWQDIFLILLNSYLRSNLSNRKDIFKRLSDKLQQLRMQEYRQSSGFHTSISVTSPLIVQTPDSLHEINTIKSKQKLISDERSINSSQTLNDSEYSITPPPTTTKRQQSLVSHENVLSPDLSNHISVSTSIKDNSSDIKSHISTNSNAIIEHPRPLTSTKQHRQYKITVIHTDEIFDISTSKRTTMTEVILFKIFFL